MHHYMRHSYVPSDRPVYVLHLLVNGYGGAFLHPMHMFSNFKKYHGTSYECKAAYPSYEDSSWCKLDHFFQDDTISGHLWSFFSTVWVVFMYMMGHTYGSSIGSIVSLVTAFVFLPPKVSLKKRAVNGVHFFQEDTISGHLWSFFSTVWEVFMCMMGHTYVSSIGTIVSLVTAFVFLPSKVSLKK